MAINNSLSHGQRSAMWSSLGNASGLFCLSAAAMLGLGALLASSEGLFNMVKIVGAGYLFYLGVRQLLNKTPLLADGIQEGLSRKPTRLKLYRSAFFTALSNPKATLFFTALFPQFIDQGAALFPQFLILTAIFMALSVSSLSLYAALASRAKGVLVRPELSRWVSRVVGVMFIGFGAAILAIRRQTA